MNEKTENISHISNNIELFNNISFANLKSQQISNIASNDEQMIEEGNLNEVQLINSKLDYSPNHISNYNTTQPISYFQNARASCPQTNLIIEENYERKSDISGIKASTQALAVQSIYNTSNREKESQANKVEIPLNNKNTNYILNPFSTSPMNLSDFLDNGNYKKSNFHNRSLVLSNSADNDPVTSYKFDQVINNNSAKMSLVNLVNQSNIEIDQEQKLNYLLQIATIYKKEEIASEILCYLKIIKMSKKNLDGRYLTELNHIIDNLKPYMTSEWRSIICEGENGRSSNCSQLPETLSKLSKRYIDNSSKLSPSARNFANKLKNYNNENQPNKLNKYYLKSYESKNIEGKTIKQLGNEINIKMKDICLNNGKNENPIEQNSKRLRKKTLIDTAKRSMNNLM